MTTENKISQTTPAKVDSTPSQRFTQLVCDEFTGVKRSDVTALKPFQQRLIKNYFLSIDRMLSTAEEKRLKKDVDKREKLEFKWENVNLNKLASDVIAYCRVGYDPALPNHINMIPFKNNTSNKYDVQFIEGYRGKQLKIEKYGHDVPHDIVVEIVYSNDHFKELKKNVNRSIESYEFEIGNSFDRGDVIGGFIYFCYFDQPEKNKLFVYSKAEIEKRKPKSASVEFWGGVKDKWEYDEKLKRNKKTGTETVDGWYREMFTKTLLRIAYDHILIDSAKLDDDLYKIIETSVETPENVLSENTQDGANGETIDIESTVVEDKPQEENKPAEIKEQPGQEDKTENKSPELPLGEPSF